MVAILTFIVTRHYFTS